MWIKRISWKKAIHIWEEIEKSNDFLSPYMMLEFQKTYKRVYRVGKKRWNKRIGVYLCTLENDRKILCPLIYDNEKVYIMGDLCATGYLDFIYPRDVTDEEFDILFCELKRILNRKRICLNKLNQSSKMAQYMLRKYEPILKNTCVNISIPESIQVYYKRLSKSTRQNIRTSMNRMEREGKAWTVNVNVGKRLSKREHKEMMRVYLKREAEREKKKISSVKAFVQTYLNPITKTIVTSSNNFYAYLSINGEMAGIMAGIITRDGSTVVIPRLAIDSKHAVYCPGTILIYKTVEWLIENTSIKNLDLSRGEERYKYVMGGHEHYNFEFDI